MRGMQITAASLEGAPFLAPPGNSGPSGNGSIIPIAGPNRITENGYYMLTGDFTIASGNGIEIRARKATSDPGGHTIPLSGSDLRE